MGGVWVWWGVWWGHGGGVVGCVVVGVVGERLTGYIGI